NSCFKDTHLHDYLQSKHISQLIMMGLQTEYCFDTSVKVAFEYGYDIFIPQGGHLTFDTPTLSGDSIKKHYENIWHHRFATMVAKDSLLKLINEE
ncbi:isochorismatase family protein, partial [Streptococcus agalactiae]|nr:isochorismatase family protein [Streptococcus agalactiae]